MIYDLVSSNDPILKQEIPNFDFSNPPTDPIQLAKDLAETMINNNGLGLSANQVGLPYRVFVITGSPILACFNPRIVDATSEEIYLDEGCLSFPNLFFKVKRPRMIKVRYNQPNGETITQKFDGITARVFLHEYDHMNGVLYNDRATSYHISQGKKRLKKFNRKN
jgi:peptide deformylase